MSFGTAIPYHGRAVPPWMAGDRVWDEEQDTYSAVEALTSDERQQLKLLPYSYEKSFEVDGWNVMLKEEHEFLKKFIVDEDLTGYSGVLTPPKSSEGYIVFFDKKLPDTNIWQVFWETNTDNLHIAHIPLNTKKWSIVVNGPLIFHQYLPRKANTNAYYPGRLIRQYGVQINKLGPCVVEYQNLRKTGTHQYAQIDPRAWRGNSLLPFWEKKKKKKKKKYSALI
eukprot:Platyproteum_vivax@DN576_c0_g1_i1.p1